MRKVVITWLALIAGCGAALGQHVTVSPPLGLSSATGAITCTAAGLCSFSSGQTIASLTVTGAFTATGLVTNADLVSAATTVNGQTCTLGSTCTAAAAAGTLTGSTLAAGVTASSLTSVGALTALTVSSTSVTAQTLGTNQAQTFLAIQTSSSTARGFIGYMTQGAAGLGFLQAAGVNATFLVSDAGAPYFPLAASSGTITGTWCHDSALQVISQNAATCIISSARHKEDIAPLTHGLDWVMAMEPKTFRYKDGYYNNSRSIGLVAEDVFAVEPLLAPVNAKGEPETIAVEMLPAVLVRAIQEQQEQIKDLKARLDSK